MTNPVSFFSSAKLAISNIVDQIDNGLKKIDDAIISLEDHPKHGAIFKRIFTATQSMQQGMLKAGDFMLYPDGYARKALDSYRIGLENEFDKSRSVFTAFKLEAMNALFGYRHDKDGSEAIISIKSPPAANLENK
ncbi:hypothetical protein FNU76_14845 [Chitinimonas arctica]|uniref:Uncharacterized protein n=1 Tax=Chitinimonas arctica TaxID=2594795 RepID=A0A516SHC3_9NEIS|nr:hypothetical protein [Chitinimonas arctica]QDQ27532.1 hypothetical protein FNU76_14845 [Chitinimonas arctica]